MGLDVLGGWNVLNGMRCPRWDGMFLVGWNTLGGMSVLGGWNVLNEMRWDRWDRMRSMG